MTLLTEHTIWYQSLFNICFAELVKFSNHSSGITSHIAINSVVSRTKFLTWDKYITRKGIHARKVMLTTRSAWNCCQELQDQKFIDGCKTPDADKCFLLKTNIYSIFETGINVVDLLAPYRCGGKIGLLKLCNLVSILIHVKRTSLSWHLPQKPELYLRFSKMLT